MRWKLYIGRSGSAQTYAILAAEVDAVAQLRLDACDAAYRSDQSVRAWREHLTQHGVCLDVEVVGVPGLIHRVADAGREREEGKQCSNGEPRLKNGSDTSPSVTRNAAQTDLCGSGQEARPAQQPVEPTLGSARAPARL